MTGQLTCRDIADRHGLRRLSRSWRGNCPACGYVDAFSMKEGRDRTPLLYCASCRDRDALARAVGANPARPDPASDVDRDADRTRKREAALRLWGGSEPAPGTLASVYLASRWVGHLQDCDDIRFRGDCNHPEGARLPAMLALVRGPDGDPVGVWRTYLRRDGGAKADIDPPRAGLGQVWGGAIRLAPIAAELVVGEGIETAAAAGLLEDLPAWAALSAGNLAGGLVLPLAVRSVVIAVDHDPAGECAAQAASKRWESEGRMVRLLIPNQPGQDAADVLAARERPHA